MSTSKTVGAHPLAVKRPFPFTVPPRTLSGACLVIPIGVRQHGEVAATQLRHPFARLLSSAGFEARKNTRPAGFLDHHVVGDDGSELARPAPDTSGAAQPARPAPPAYAVAMAECVEQVERQRRHCGGSHGWLAEKHLRQSNRGVGYVGGDGLARHRLGTRIWSALATPSIPRAFHASPMRAMPRLMPVTQSWGTCGLDVRGCERAMPLSSGAVLPEGD